MVRRENSPMPLVVSLPPCTPGGMARQYRIQYRTAAIECWRMYATFAQRSPAEQCLSQLVRAGHEARLVCYGRFPTAR